MNTILVTLGLVPMACAVLLLLWCIWHQLGDCLRANPGARGYEAALLCYLLWLGGATVILVGYSLRLLQGGA